MDISELNKAEVLAALYNAARPLGMGYFEYKASAMNVEEAKNILKTQKVFDYLYGRVMHITIDGNEIDTTSYDISNNFYSGTSVSQMVIDFLNLTGDVNAPGIKLAHVVGLQLSLDRDKAFAIEAGKYGLIINYINESTDSAATASSIDIPGVIESKEYIDYEIDYRKNAPKQA